MPISFIWMAGKFSLEQKLRLHRGGVVSVLVSGHSCCVYETLKLDPKTQASLKGWNARCLESSIRFNIK